MTDHRGKVRSFLKANMPEPTWVMTVMTRLEPFFQVAELGQYPLPLPPKEEISDNRLFRALNSAFGISITRFERVSRKHAALVPERLEVLNSRQSYALGRAFADSMDAADGHRLDSALDPLTWFAMIDAVDTHLMRPMANALGHDLAPWLGHFLKQYVTAALIGEQDLFEGMNEMVKLLPYAFPVGALAGDKAVWVVLE